MDHLTWNVDPEIFQIGPIAPGWYGLLFALGFALGYFVLAQIYRHEGRSENSLSSLFSYVFLGTLIGARLGHVLFYQPDYYLARPWEIFMIWQGGLASHGGFIGVLIAIYFYVKKHSEMGFLELADRLAIAALPAAGLIRIGNFFNSESWVCRRISPGASYFFGSTVFQDIRRCYMNLWCMHVSLLAFTSPIGKAKSSRLPDVF